ncbi:MAG: family 10 glycosylhydrolase [Deltaproteobacteria bacterium]|nr:family 10 glycosylhydrolase [Deltaproteobacteria bacterium]MBW2362526.1 family 10 glycosylhydrolase [Deltaproteobacteria bacterium]
MRAFKFGASCALSRHVNRRVLAFLLLLPLVLEAEARAEASPRGLWVLCEGSQRVLEHPERIDRLLADARAMGVSDLFVQVYRGGRAWFASSLADPAPYAATFREGERDALQVLIARAHEAGLRVHAWVNVLSMAGHAEGPLLRDLGRRAVAVDQHGRSILDYPEFEVPPPDREYYRMGTPAVWLDPAAPGVAERLAETLVELVRGYPGLDGLHLDYVRYPDVLPYSPGTRFGVGLSFGYGEFSRLRFQRETGLAAPQGKSVLNANRWDDWRRAKLTQLVALIGRSARAEQPRLRISAAVIADRERAYLVDFQDWASWLDDGLLDFAVPMLYTRDATLLRHGVEALSGLGARREIWVGLGSWLFSNQPEEAMAQLERVEQIGGLGSALFSWDYIAEHPELLDALTPPPAVDPMLPAAPAEASAAELDGEDGLRSE